MTASSTRSACSPHGGQIRKWLKAGVVDKGRYSPTEEGTPQDGVISPLLLNIALHGMEEAAGVRYRKHNPAAVMPASPVIIRYADDYVALCRSRRQAEETRIRLKSWLADRGLSFNEEKTQIVHASDGFDQLQRPAIPDTARRQAAHQTQQRSDHQEPATAL
jgi:RNA-directed DNA polymerase